MYKSIEYLPLPALPQQKKLVISQQWGVATVVQPGQRLQIRLIGSSDLRSADCAAGVLLQPQRGDTVLLFMSGANCWATQVLTRYADTPAELAVPGAPQVILSAPELTMRSTGGLALEADVLRLQAKHTTASLGVVRLSAQVMHLVAQRFVVWADLIHTRAQALVIRAEQRVSKIDRSDILQAGQVIVEGEQLLQLKGRQIQVQAKENVLIDGKRILMG